MSLAQDLGEVHRPWHWHPGDQHGCGPPVVADRLPVETTPLPGDSAERRPVCWGRPWCDPFGRTLRTQRGIRPPQRPLDSVRLGAANRPLGIVDDLDPCLLGTARWEELRQQPRASYLEFRFSQHAPLRRARRVDEPNVPAACSLTVSAWCQRCLHDHDNRCRRHGERAGPSTALAQAGTPPAGQGQDRGPSAGRAGSSSAGSQPRQPRPFLTGGTCATGRRAVCNSPGLPPRASGSGGRPVPPKQRPRPPTMANWLAPDW